MLQKIKYKLIVLLFYLFRVFPIKNNKIIVSMFNGKGYGAEGKSIVDAILKSGNKYDIVWVCKTMKENVPQGIRKVKFNSLSFIYEYVTSKIWIDNRRKNTYFRKRKNQIYIQTWHASVGIKKVEKDAGNKLPASYIRSAIHDSEMADFFVSGSERRTKNYLSAFWYNGPIIKGDLYGFQDRISRMDEISLNIKKTFNIPENSNIVLYAPTFRNDRRVDHYDLDYHHLLSELKTCFGGNWYLIVRLHPNIPLSNDQISYDDHVINGSFFPHVYDLIAACDILISDFSSVIFDGYRMRKKVFLYASDFFEYLEKERDLYFDFTNLPSPYATSNDNLYEIISAFDTEKYESKRKTLVNEIGYYPDDAAPKILKIVNESN